MEVKLSNNSQDREKYDNLADLFSILTATEHLERLYIRDAITVQEYTVACQKLIAQYKTAVGLLGVGDVEQFMREYGLTCAAAVKRLVTVGVPATIEHGEASGEQNSAKTVAETVQYFITLMDSLKLNYVAVDQIHPQLSDLIQSIHRVSLPKEYEGKAKIRNWLIVLNKMKASDELSADQVRQLLFDLERQRKALNHLNQPTNNPFNSSYSEFNRFI